jgi:acetyl-CoA carboxylase carboxyl transferase subunit beta
VAFLQLSLTLQSFTELQMAWYQRNKEGITTSATEKIQAPDGLWVKCPACKKPTHVKELTEQAYVCPFCGHHHRIGSEEYFHLLFDDLQQVVELNPELKSANPLDFKDTKAYPDRLAASEQDTGLKDALRTAVGKLHGRFVVVCCMDFSFIGGSMGCVVGEKISRAVDYAIANRLPLVIISKSGGARMMEGALSLMQMAKTSAKLALLAKARLPYISLLTDPTTGGVTASYAMLGDINLAEPGALIGFAGPRVIRETIGRDLPEGFQRAEFLLEKGFVDQIVNRKELKDTLAKLLAVLLPAETEVELTPRHRFGA